MAERARLFDGKKYLWDGQEYDTEAAARKAEKEYASNGFEVRLWREQELVLLYTRRVVTEVIVDEG
ncbi:MAG: hypothetical protein GTO22_03105 [Gemmatimonadales bacterium]|nr:hypothetical protein [Gemmatimonadales bacterium]